jgi:hypothetical protein
MMTLIAPFLPYIVAALGLLASAFGIAWGRKTAQTAKAQADAAKPTPSRRCARTGC